MTEAELFCTFMEIRTEMQREGRQLRPGDQVLSDDGSSHLTVDRVEKVRRMVVDIHWREPANPCRFNADEVFRVKVVEA